MKMQTYAEFQPTGFDGPSNFACFDREVIETIQSWLVGPSRTRDSGCLDESNFGVVLKDLGGEGENVQVQRFGHWACGWYELILVRPDTPQATSLANWISALSNYPVADESDLSERELEVYLEAWDNFGASDFASALSNAYPHHGTDFYRAIPNAALMLAWEALTPSGEYVIHEDSGCYFPFDTAIGKRSGALKPDYAEVCMALRDAIFEHTRRSKCCHYRPMKSRDDLYMCSKCGGSAGDRSGFERGETTTP